VYVRYRLVEYRKQFLKALSRTGRDGAEATHAWEDGPLLSTWYAPTLSLPYLHKMALRMHLYREYGVDSV
jgi:hypothetical protein